MNIINVFYNVQLSQPFKFTTIENETFTVNEITVNLRTTGENHALVENPYQLYHLNFPNSTILILDESIRQ